MNEFVDEIEIYDLGSKKIVNRFTLIGVKLA